jgi:hypothetical protein
MLLSAIAAADFSLILVCALHHKRRAQTKDLLENTRKLLVLPTLPSIQSRKFKEYLVEQNHFQHAPEGQC